MRQTQVILELLLLEMAVFNNAQSLQHAAFTIAYSLQKMG